MKAAREYKKQQSRVLQPKASKSVVQCIPLTRSMTKIIAETVFTSEHDVWDFYNTFKRKYSEVSVLEMINKILAPNHALFDGKQIYKKDETFSEEKMEEDDIDCAEVHYDEDEFEANRSYHGDLDNYEDEDKIKEYLMLHPVQCARKGNTISGPKNYIGKQGWAYKKVSYMTGHLGEIYFDHPLLDYEAFTNPVVSDSLVNLPNYITKSNRQQHFALADHIYGQRHGCAASEITKKRKGKYTWHHLPTKYHMVLVDMTVHAKHGHNGGVYLW